MIEAEKNIVETSEIKFKEVVQAMKHDSIKNFIELKQKYDEINRNSKQVECFLPVHCTVNKIETNLYNSQKEHNEQYYKWQFLTCFVQSGLCSKDYIGVEVNFPKGNKNASNIKLDGAIFDDKNWYEHYKKLHTCCQCRQLKQFKNIDYNYFYMVYLNLF